MRQFLAHLLLLGDKRCIRLSQHLLPGGEPADEAVRFFAITLIDSAITPSACAVLAFADVRDVIDCEDGVPGADATAPKRGVGGADKTGATGTVSAAADASAANVVPDSAGMDTPAVVRPSVIAALSPGAPGCSLWRKDSPESRIAFSTFSSEITSIDTPLSATLPTGGITDRSRTIVAAMMS
jgi:hypothetical protein